jgi:hypothetical protein
MSLHTSDMLPETKSHAQKKILNFVLGMLEDLHPLMNATMTHTNPPQFPNLACNALASGETIFYDVLNYSEFCFNHSRHDPFLKTINWLT